MVVNVSTGERGGFVENPAISHLIAIDNTVATLPKILSNRYKGALLGIELVNRIAALSTYPSAKALELLKQKVISAVQQFVESGVVTPEMENISSIYPDLLMTPEPKQITQGEAPANENTTNNHTIDY